MIGAHPGRALIALARIFSLLVGLAAILCAARTVRRSVAYFGGPPQKVYPEKFRAQVREVEAHLAVGDVVLYAPAVPEFWISRLWQRALYPRNPVVIAQPLWGAPRLAELRARYGARFAIAAGNPPADPGFAWKLDLGHVPGASERIVFGELRP